MSRDVWKKPDENKEQQQQKKTKHNKFTKQNKAKWSNIMTKIISFLMVLFPESPRIPLHPQFTVLFCLSPTAERWHTLGTSVCLGKLHRNPADHAIWCAGSI